MVLVKFEDPCNVRALLWYPSNG